VHIDEISLADLLSFGPEQHIKGLKKFNLFIGKNGAGKSNIFRLLSDPPLEFKPLNGSIPIRGGLVDHRRQVTAYKVEFELDDSRNSNLHQVREPFLNTTALTISYRSSAPDLTPKRIVFRAGEQVEGDLVSMSKSVSLIEPSDPEFDLSKFFKRREGGRLFGPLSFGLFYIFEKPIMVTPHGSIGEIFSRPPGKRVFGGGWNGSRDGAQLSQGQLYCVKLLAQYLGLASQVVLIDEP